MRMRVAPDASRRAGGEHVSMSAATNAVSWLTPAGDRCAGRLGVDGRGLTLLGASCGCPVKQEIPFDQIEDVHVEAGRLQVMQRDGDSLAIGSLDAPGALRELAERLARAAG
jgi:hypothetical protein